MILDPSLLILKYCPPRFRSMLWASDMSSSVVVENLVLVETMDEARLCLLELLDCISSCNHDGWGTTGGEWKSGSSILGNGVRSSVNRSVASYRSSSVDGTASTMVLLEVVLLMDSDLCKLVILS